MMIKPKKIIYLILFIFLLQLPSLAEPEATQKGPAITFENTVHNFGQIFINEKVEYAFKFKNSGSDLLTIGSVNSTCGCTVPSLDKTDYNPGEEGIIRVIYSSPSFPDEVSKEVTVPTNDPNNKTATLTINAKVVDFVQAEPKNLQLLLNKKNGGIGNITIKCYDKKPFSINSLTSTGNLITAAIDPNSVGEEFILTCVVDINSMKSLPQGSIDLTLNHPEKHSLKIPFSVLPEFNVRPPVIRTVSKDPEKSGSNTVTISSNYQESFEIESVESLNDFVKLDRQQRTPTGYTLYLLTTAPENQETPYLTDTLYVNIRGRKRLEIRCSMHILKAGIPGSQQPIANSKDFSITPPTLSITDAEPLTPILKEVHVAGKAPFEIIAMSSKNSIISVIDTGDLENNRRIIKLKITPPEQKERTIFSDVLFLTIKPSDQKDSPVKLSLYCRGTFKKK